MRLHVLSLGSCDVDRGRLLTPGIREGERQRIPIPAYLLETGTGERVLIDTGMHAVHIDDPVHTFRESPEVADILRPVMTREDLIAHRLGEIGLAVGDVTHVVNTHLHFDHCGQNSTFTDVPILVHREHFAAALAGDAFPNEYFDLPLRYELFDGDRVELFPGVTTITTHGHAPYHQSLLVELPRTGPVLLAVDAIYVRDNLTYGAWESQQDPEAAAAGGARLTALAEERGALLVYGHDPEQWATLARAYD
jgi:N-acyl homoserine lactone hydrolase